MRKSILNSTEIAFQAYIQSIQSTSVLAPVNIYAAQQLTLIQPTQPGGIVSFANIQPPNLIFMASNPQQFEPDVLIYELKLQAILETQVDDEMDVANQDIHHQRVEALRDALEGLTGYPINVANQIYLSSLIYQSDEEKEEDRRFTSIIDYYVIAEARTN